MQVFQSTGKIIITCSNRLSPYLAQEVEALGYTPVRFFKTGVELKGTMQDCIKLNMNLRTASQVLFAIHSFIAADANTLYVKLLNFNWDDILTVKTYFAITSNVNNDTINNSLFANVKVKDAIVDWFISASRLRSP